jgi:DNA replication and repair protein RecF
VRLVWIEVQDFRNYREAMLEVPPGATSVLGPNGQGKTNLLEAMCYVCSLSSPRVAGDLPLVRTGVPSAFLRAEAESGGGRLLIEVEVRAGGTNRVQVNRSPVRRRRDLRQKLRAVFSAPDDLAIVQGDPAERRRFMDQAVAALWPAREGVAAAYERALRQRNRLLKDWTGVGGPPGLEGWDAELVALGAELTDLREAAVGELSARAAEEFRTMSGLPGHPLTIQYRPSVVRDDAEGADHALGETARAFRAQLATRRGDELVRRTTLVGPHRDDLGLTVERLAARGFASHGEAWGVALSLRLALADAVAAAVGERPVLFLDDPFSGFDPERRRRVSEGLRDRGQVVIAVPDPAHALPGSTVWNVRGGEVRPQDGAPQGRWEATADAT